MTAKNRVPRTDFRDLDCNFEWGPRGPRDDLRYRRNRCEWPSKMGSGENREKSGQTRFLVFSLMKHSKLRCRFFFTPPPEKGHRSSVLWGLRFENPISPPGHTNFCSNACPAAEIDLGRPIPGLNPRTPVESREHLRQLQPVFPLSRFHRGAGNPP